MKIIISYLLNIFYNGRILGVVYAKIILLIEVSLESLILLCEVLLSLLADKHHHCISYVIQNLFGEVDSSQSRWTIHDKDVLNSCVLYAENNSAIRIRFDVIPDKLEVN